MILAACEWLAPRAWLRVHENWWGSPVVYFSGGSVQQYHSTYETQEFRRGRLRATVEIGSGHDKRFGDDGVRALPDKDPCTTLARQIHVCAATYLIARSSLFSYTARRGASSMTSHGRDWSRHAFPPQESRACQHRLTSVPESSSRSTSSSGEPS